MKTFHNNNASIFVPSIEDYVEIVGGKIEIVDNIRYLKIICADSKGNEVLLNPLDLVDYFQEFIIPF